MPQPLIRDTFDGNNILINCNTFAAQNRAIPDPEEIRSIVDFGQQYPIARLLLAFHRLYTAWAILNRDHRRGREAQIDAIMNALRTERATRTKAGERFSFSDIEPILRDVIE
jgi:hypothetical protein